MNDLVTQRNQEYKNHLEQFLKEYYAFCNKLPQAQLFDAMNYSLMAGGKRLRPLLTMEFCRLCCGDWKKAAPFASAVEMIHTYSLIHDDLPSMDNDDFRRGRPTSHKVYGEAQAILAGDALLTDAFMIAASQPLDDPEKLALAISVLGHNAGSMGMVGGQVLDISSEDRQLTEQEVLDIQTRKTGALINSACVLGVIAGGGNEDQIEAATKYAAGIGLAFQIRDDMLDVIGTQEEMGKGVGTDANKNTFVRLYGLEKCEELVQKYTDLAINALDIFEDTEYLITLANQLAGRTT